jgi:hypothetical protein
MYHTLMKLQLYRRREDVGFWIQWYKTFAEFNLLPSKNFPTSQGSLSTVEACLYLICLSPYKFYSCTPSHNFSTNKDSSRHGVVLFSTFLEISLTKCTSSMFFKHHIQISRPHFERRQCSPPPTHIFSLQLFCSREIFKCTDIGGIALGYGLDDRGSRVWFPAGAGNISLHHRVQNGSGAHPASCPMGTGCSFLGGKAAGA